MNEQLSYSKILRFWLPLSATWLMMSVEGPFLTAIIARMHNPEFNLAAYGVAYTIALIIESPVIMMLSASTTLVENKETFFKLRNFAYAVNAIITVAMIIFILPPVFNFFAIKLIELPHRVAHLTHMAAACLIPWAPAIGYRRFYQGILIRNNLTRYVAYGTVIRLASMGITALVLYLFTKTEGVVVGAAALSAGVVVEAAAARLMSISTLKKITNENEKQLHHITYKEIFWFYYPLALTSFISLGFQPVVVFFIGHSRSSLESLAVLPVINSLVFLWRSLGLSIPEVVIALINTKEEYIKLRNFAFRLAIVVAASLGIVTFTPLSDLWLLKTSGLSYQLTQFSKLPLMFYTIFPSLTVWINFQRSILIYSRDTKPMTAGIITEVAGMFIVLFVTVVWLDFTGIVAAVLAMTLGRLAANFYLISPFNKAVKKICA
ncbi:MAG: hypothetical protein AB1298_02695 [Bacteroidota bacterium]